MSSYFNVNAQGHQPGERSGARRPRALLLLPLVFGGVIFAFAGTSGAAGCTVPASADPVVVATAHREALSSGASSRVQLANLMTIWVESHANALRCGHGTSLGAYQQTRSWGSPASRIDTASSARRFLAQANSIDAQPGSANLTAGQIAQKVQRSAYPARYDQVRGIAQGLRDQARGRTNGGAAAEPNRGWREVGWKLTAGERLNPGSAMVSPDGRFRLENQADGNIVLYQADVHHALWATGTRGAGPVSLEVQSDGNVVAYTTDRRPVYATGTAGAGPVTLELQNDADLVTYAVGQRPVAASDTRR